MGASPAQRIVGQSSGAPAVVTLAGEQRDGVVIFHPGEEPDAVLQGFTIRNGARGPSPFGGSGIGIAGGASPTIRDNVITENRASSGAAIVVYTGSPTIVHNQIVSNHGGSAV